MKRFGMLFALLFLVTVFVYSQKIKTKEFDYTALGKDITQEKYVGSDAVIIHQETYMHKKLESNRFVEDQREITLVKVLTKAGIDDYSNFKLLGSQSSKVKFSVFVRVIKPDQTIYTYGDEILQISDYGEKRRNKLLAYTCIIPKLEVNDIVHIEKHFSYPGLHTNEIYPLTSVHPVLYSKIHMITHEKLNARIQIFPSNAAKISKTLLPDGNYEFILEAKNLPAIKSEQLRQPPGDLDYLACISFYNISYSNFISSWDGFAHGFYINNILNRGLVASDIPEEWQKYQKNLMSKIKNAELEERTTFEKYYKENLPAVSMTPEEIYSFIRNKYKLGFEKAFFRSKYKLDELLSSKTLNSLDMLYLFLKICERYKHKASFAFIREKQNGLWEEKYPTLNWFDKVVAVAYIDGKPRYFEFSEIVDKNGKHLPWNSQGVTIVLYDEGLGKIVKIPVLSNNEFAQKITYKITENKTDVQINETRIGYFSDIIRRDIMKLKTKFDIEEYLYYNYGMYGNFIKDFKYDTADHEKIELSYGIELNPQRLSQGYAFLTLSAPDLNNTIRTFYDNERYYDIYFQTPKKYIYTFEVEFDKKYQPMQIPQSYTFTAIPDFYISVATELQQNKLITTYTLQHTKAIFSYKQYGQMRNAIREAYAVLTRDIVFKKL